MSDILSKLSQRSDEHEFYSPVPKDYKPGKTKYIIITGSVISGVGKGTFTSSLAALLKFNGLKVSPIKFDGYLNYDAGTLNPYRHGEVFVLSDGTECDLDLGSYERFTNETLTRNNYLTSGKIFKDIIDRERAGKYLGRDVQVIPHVTGEAKRFLRNLAISSEADVVILEVGGTIGDLENSYFIEAMRELAYEEGKENVCFVNVTYILQPSSLGEHKSKAAQLGLRTLMALGIQPDIVVCRSNTPVNDKVREKVSVFANVKMEHVINITNIENMYSIPLELKRLEIDKAILERLGLKPKKNGDKDFNVENWEGLVDKFNNLKEEIKIAVVGKYTFVHDSYLSIIKALEHCSMNLGIKVKIKWVESTEIEDNKITPEEAFKDVQGIIVPGGFGKRGIEGKIASVKYARENNIPFLGLCLGFQMAVIEFARNVLELRDAHSSEIEKGTTNPVIHIMESQKDITQLGGNMRLGSYPAVLKEGTKIHNLYGKTEVSERHRHRYEVNPKYIGQIEEKGMIFSGKSPNGLLMEFLELKDHKCFIATQAHPEFTSRPLSPNPLFMGLVKAAIK